MKFPLLHPITIGKAIVSELTFRDHTVAGDYLAFDQRGGVAQRIALIASVAGTDVALIQRLHGADYQRAEKIIDALLTADEVAANPKPTAMAVARDDAGTGTTSAEDLINGMADTIEAEVLKKK
ncbi:phage tail assembly protein [Rhodoferax sp. BLA1]|uniref:phage tail assembly protein n=1 Tax=Rhodoferax sp. BLA1 TaxID=2576062 RepID=UPI0015D41224|nr:phage tail assembly protein [Rhodoferax sp. BLA1]